MGFPFGYGYPGVCDEGSCSIVATHQHEGKQYCRRHYRTVVQRFTDCMGCRSTGVYHDHGIPTKRPCPLCKGEGVLAP